MQSSFFLAQWKLTKFGSICVVLLIVDAFIREIGFGDLSSALIVLILYSTFLFIDIKSGSNFLFPVRREIFILWSGYIFLAYSVVNEGVFSELSYWMGVVFATGGFISVGWKAYFSNNS